LELDLKEPIKKALAAAKSAFEERDYSTAAAAYDKAAELMSRFAEQAIGREAEMRRKRKSIEYREAAQKLRNGEFADPDEGRPPSGARRDKAPAAPAGAAELRDQVSGLIHHASVGWDDIGGLEATKQEIKFALGMTLARPPKGVRIAAWTKMLFYGPPGTGKTLLAAATSNAVRSTEGVPSVFFNVKISAILSKYFGESSKIVGELYGMARDASPSVVFLDEFESICGRRDASDSGAERRILSTILSELDGLDQKGRSDLYVLTIAATNRPWDLDPAVLSRFEKKILIPLPDPPAREAILRICLERQGFETEVPYAELARLTDGASGREIERFCKQSVNHMIQETNREIPGLVDQGLDKVRSHGLRVRRLTRADFERAARLLTPQTTPEEMRKYEEWKEYMEA
jgi:SpoVK/Ycf46/Vps4 family AAA+-type ATPase